MRKRICSAGEEETNFKISLNPMQSQIVRCYRHLSPKSDDGNYLVQMQPMFSIAHSLVSGCLRLATILAISIWEMTIESIWSISFASPRCSPKLPDTLPICEQDVTLESILSLRLNIVWNCVNSSANKTSSRRISFRVEIANRTDGSKRSRRSSFLSDCRSWFRNRFPNKRI